MSTEQRCNNGHFYNPAKFSSCPHCGVAGIDIGPTRVGGQRAPTMPLAFENAPAASVPRPPAPSLIGGQPINRAAASSTEQATVGWYPSRDEKAGEQRIDPIVGWLVCVDGPDKGRDFRIKAEKNFIGRSTAMDICIAGDPRVSRENHAIVAFDPRNTEFRLYAGGARGLVYLNGQMVDMPVILQPFDTIELGDSHLVFVPFCGEHFRWPEKL
jgi:hypothetical protein